MIRLRVPGSLTYRHLALRVVAAACKMAAPRGVGGESPGLSAEEFEAQTVSAFGEAFNNIAIHGYRTGPPGDVDIHIASDEDGIEILLMDTGNSFDPGSIDVPLVDDLPESGMGLFIIKSFMDEVEYHPGTPNVLRLMKRRDGSLYIAGDEGERDSDQQQTDADFSESSNGQRESSFRMRGVSHAGVTRAAGGIKIQ